MNTDTSRLAEILSERHRQERLRAEGRFEWTCATLGPTDAQRLVVLTEELGEVAHAIKVKNRLTTNRTGDGDLRTELIQVCAVALAWIEGLDKENEHGGA